jgi:hypothetical protein
MIREFLDGVSFREFRAMASAYTWSVDRILEHIGPHAFGGPSTSPYYESPTAYLTRVLRPAHAVDDDLVIPYRCLIQLYVEQTRLPRATRSDSRRCRCGCGSPVWGTYHFAADSCRRRGPKTAPRMSPP